LALITNVALFECHREVAKATRNLIYQRATENKKLGCLAIQGFLHKIELYEDPLEFVVKETEYLADDICVKKHVDWDERNYRRIDLIRGVKNFNNSNKQFVDKELFKIDDVSSTFQLWTMDQWRWGVLAPVILQELRSKILEQSFDELIVCCPFSKDRTGVVFCAFLALDVVPVILKKFYQQNPTANLVNDLQELEKLTNNIASFLIHTIHTSISPCMIEDWAMMGLRELIRQDILNFEPNDEYTPFYEWPGGDLKKLFDEFVEKWFL